MPKWQIFQANHMLSTLDFEGISAVVGPWFIAFTLMIARISAIFIATPIFSTPLIPIQAKIGLVTCLSIMGLSFISPPLSLINMTNLDLIICLVTELIVGAIMGLGLMVLFGALAFAGQLVGIQMGFAIANVVDPVSSQQVGVLAQLLKMLGLALFIALDAHLLVLRSLFDSFDVIPLGGAIPKGDEIIAVLIEQGGQLFALGLKLALPISCVVLLVNVALATIARTVPQVNIFVLGFLFTIGLGLLILLYSVPYTAGVFEGMLHDAIRTGIQMTRLF